MPVVLLNPGLSGMPGLFSVDLATSAGDAVCFHPKVILDHLKEMGYFPMQEVYSSVRTLLMQLEISATKAKKATDVGSSLGVSSQQGGLRA